MDIVWPLISVVLSLFGTISVGYFVGERFGILYDGNMLLYVPIAIMLFKVFKDVLCTPCTPSCSGTRRETGVCVAAGIMFLLWFVLGTMTETDGFSVEKAFQYMPYAVFLGITVVCLLIWLFRKMSHWQSTAEMDLISARWIKGRLFVAWALIFCSWMVCYLGFLPGVWAYDTPSQLKQFYTGVYSTHHPLLHTLYVGSMVKLGDILFGSWNAGAILYCISQMLILSAIFAYVSVTLLKAFGIPKVAYILLLAFFMFYPLNAVYSFTATKDVLFAGFFLLTVVLFAKGWHTKEIFGGGSRETVCWLKISASCIAMMLCRNNALYAFVIFSAVVFFAVKQKGKAAARLFFIIGLYLCIASGLQMSLGATSGSIGEMFSVPLQQIARAVRDNSDEITDEEMEIIYEVVTENGVANYTSGSADPVKGIFNEDAFLADPLKYIGVYVRVGLKCPITYLNAFLDLSLRYWYPYSTNTGWFMTVEVWGHEKYEWADEEDYFSRIEVGTQIRTFVTKLVSNRSYREEMPVISLIFNMGAYVWVYFGIMAYMIYARDRLWIPFSLVFGLWFTILLAPISLSRYIYPLILCVPVMACLLVRKNRAGVEIVNADSAQMKK